MIFKLIEAPLVTDYGSFVETVYTDGCDQAISIHMGDLSGEPPPLVRIHSHCISSHVFFGVGCDCRHQMALAQRLVAKEGRGLIIWLDQEGRANGHVAKLASEHWKALNFEQGDAYVRSGYLADRRDYSLAVKIIKHFSLASVRLITHNRAKNAAVADAGIQVECVPSTET